MPAIYFHVALGDREERCYSPSTIVCELLQADTDYPLFEFMARTRAALTIGSERVRLKYGYYCSAASDQLARLEEMARQRDPTETVRVTTMGPG